MTLAPHHLAWTGRRLGSVVVVAGLALAGVGLLGATPASASTQCSDNTDVCIVVPDTVQTPLGLVSVTVSDTHVVTVRLDPTRPNTLVFGVPFSYPPGPPVLPGYTRTTIDTAGGLVAIDTMIPPGPPARFARRNLAIISIHPPSPCRAATSGTTVVFTPIIPPGPPV